MFNKILIANRGEIACRVMRTAKDMGISTVAVYSEADTNAKHVREADEAVLIGPAPAAESYLKGDVILEVAKKTGAEAIHPGYGFLSENAEFADKCEKAGIVFIGPKADTIRAMGSKSNAKDMMIKAGVPVVPGYQGEDQSLKTFKKESKAIGYPVLLKATAGGGGKGMRLVEKEADLAEALESAQREAKSSFGDDRFLVEKYVGKPRHVEVQIFGDAHGNIVHLFERDCSVQRRHQKIIEEAPAPNLPDNVRAALHQAAILAAKAVDYVGAGTVEFLYDGANDIYFMEMNTRLQVEHPVTEMITDEDLVDWQLRVASGEELPRMQDEIECYGHAFEARLYAEDPANNFMPSIGPLTTLELPEELSRIDSGVEEEAEVTSFYDPMIAKIITHASSRDQALAQMRQALSETYVAGLETNAQFLFALADHPAFKNAEIDTHFIEQHADKLFEKPQLSDQVIVAACLCVLFERQDGIVVDENDIHSPWASLSGWRMNRSDRELIWLVIDGELTRVRVEDDELGFSLLIGESEQELFVQDAAYEDGKFVFSINNMQSKFFVAEHKGNLRIWSGADFWDVGIGDPSAIDVEHAAAEGSLSAPMPGVITALKAKAGVKVSSGDTLLLMEAMKMEYAVHAPHDGTVTAFHFKVGDNVGEGDILVEMEEA